MRCGIYKHYKGGFYQVLGVAEHTETHDRVVAYVSLTGIDLKGPRMRVRPLHGSEGFETYVRVQMPSGDDSGMVPRFQYIGDEL